MPQALVFERKPVDAVADGGFGAIYKRDDGTTYKHRGVDFPCPPGTPVVAPAAGTVVEFSNNGSFGIGVCLDHVGTRWFSLYAHLSVALVAIGDRVTPGQLIGRSGNTGLSTGPHLHWQVCDTSSFPTDFDRSTDPLAMIATPGGGGSRAEPVPLEVTMTPAERELLLQVATVVAGTKDGKEYTSVEAALTRFRDLSARDEILLEGLAATQERVGKLEGFVSDLLTHDHD